MLEVDDEQNFNLVNFLTFWSPHRPEISATSNFCFFSASTLCFFGWPILKKKENLFFCLNYFWACKVNDRIPNQKCENWDSLTYKSTSLKMESHCSSFCCSKFTNDENFLLDVVYFNKDENLCVCVSHGCTFKGSVGHVTFRCNNCFFLSFFFSTPILILKFLPYLLTLLPIYYFT